MERDFINYNEAAERVVKEILKLKKGDYIAHKTIAAIAEIEYYTTAYVYLIHKVKDKLIDKGIVLKTMLGYGYKLLNTNEIADEIQEKYIKLAQRKINKAKLIMQNTDTSELNTNEEKEYFAITQSEIREISTNLESTIQATGLQLRLRKEQLLKEAL